MRSLLACFGIAAMALFICSWTAAQPQPPAPPPSNKPDAKANETISEKSKALRQAIRELKAKKIDDVIVVEVEIYLKAVENIARFDEWFNKESVKWTLTALDTGLRRAREAEKNQAPWRQVRGKWISRAYRSRVDSSAQPYAVLFPPDYGADPKKNWRLDIVLHGRDAALTEAKFLGTHDGGNAPKGRDFIQLEIFGRGNNAYRWAGETDVFEAIASLNQSEHQNSFFPTAGHAVLRGFSMGGAGTWHIGLHYPSQFRVMGPGAGFSTTRGYVPTPKNVPDYVDKCLHIYDAVDYAENVFDIPIVAYSGADDPQKAAADNIENALKGFQEPYHFTHLIAPGLKHQMPAEWQAKAETEYRKYASGPRATPTRVRFVTYTPRYGSCHWITIEALHKQYTRAMIDARLNNDMSECVVHTENIKRFRVRGRDESFIIDGQKVMPLLDKSDTATFQNLQGKWQAVPPDRKNTLVEGLEKNEHLPGPIDDAFRDTFVVVKPAGAGWFPGIDRTHAVEQFAALWERHFRGDLPVALATEVEPIGRNLILFGDPGNNPLIARVLPRLPITWTKEKLIVDGVEYDPKTHLPVLIYPNPLDPSRYVVINSGHTFGRAEMEGSNALLYPRLGDWAVLKPAGMGKDEAVAAGLFDESWEFTRESFLAPGAKLEKLWSEGVFTEGPAQATDGCIYFSDIGDRIMKFNPSTGKTEVFREKSGKANGLKFDGAGRLLACEGADVGGNRRVSLTEKDGTVKTVAASWQGNRFNSPNDLTLDARGRIYFSDPRYVGTEKREIDRESVYRIDPDGTVARVVVDVLTPNGLVISVDGKTLYVSDNTAAPQGVRQLLSFPLLADGSCGKKTILYDFGADRGIDGMAITTKGMIVATAGSKDTAGIYFLSPEGKKLGFLPTPEDPSNCCFGGPARDILYITAGKSLYRIATTLTGAPTVPKLE